MRVFDPQSLFGMNGRLTHFFSELLSIMNVKNDGTLRGVNAAVQHAWGSLTEDSHITSIDAAKHRKLLETFESLSLSQRCDIPSEHYGTILFFATSAKEHVNLAKFIEFSPTVRSGFSAGNLVVITPASEDQARHVSDHLHMDNGNPEIYTCEESEVWKVLGKWKIRDTALRGKCLVIAAQPYLLAATHYVQRSLGEEFTVSWAGPSAPANTSIVTYLRAVAQLSDVVYKQLILKPVSAQ